MKTIIALALAGLFSTVSGAQTVAVLFHGSGGAPARSVPDEITTGALDMMYSEGLIVTSSSPSSPSGDSWFAASLAEAREGLVEWLLVIDAGFASDGKPGNPPVNLAWSLFRVSDGFLTGKGPVDLVSWIGRIDQDAKRSYRLMGAAAATAALKVIRSPRSQGATGGESMAPNGGKS
jgi:hypothetical protein